MDTKALIEQLKTVVAASDADLYEGDKIKVKAAIALVELTAVATKAQEAGSEEAAAAAALKEAEAEFAPVLGKALTIFFFFFFPSFSQMNPPPALSSDWIESILKQLEKTAGNAFMLASESLLASLVTVCEITGHIGLGLSVISPPAPKKTVKKDAGKKDGGKKDKGKQAGESSNAVATLAGQVEAVQLNHPATPHVETIRTRLSQLTKSLESLVQRLGDSVEKLMKDTEAYSKLFLSKDGANVALLTSAEGPKLMKVTGYSILRSLSASLTEIHGLLQKKRNLLG